jgi:ribosomal protein S18 acetylase RimI-like enzyme
MSDGVVHVRYLELTEAPAPIRGHLGRESIGLEKPSLTEYLDLYRRVGEPVRWDQRLEMPPHELISLLASARSRLYILRHECGQALGLCEFERSLREIELKNFGLVPAAQGKGLGSWLLRTALHHEWQSQPARIWLHTDTWDHPAAVHLYESAGFRTYRVREEPSAGL